MHLFSYAISKWTSVTHNWGFIYFYQPKASSSVQPAETTHHGPRTLTRLFLNQPDQIIAGIKRMKPTSDTAKEQIDKTIHYLSERKDMINYGSLKRGGYQIGSGGN